MHQRDSDTEVGGVFAEHAARYAGMGWRVFPITPGATKPPLVKDWPTNASSDLQQIERWARSWPNANIGLACGADSDALGIDADTKNGKPGILSMKQLQRDLGELPKNCVAKTPSGGRHVITAWPMGFPDDAIRSSVEDIAPGVDIRAHHGYLVLPPSVTPKGSYSWAKLGTPQPLPQAWVERLRVRGDAGQRTAVLAQFEADAEDVTDKQGVFLFHMACTLWETVGTPQLVLASLRSIQQARCPDLDADDPWTDDDLVKIVNSARNYVDSLSVKTAAVISTASPDKLQIISDGKMQATRQLEVLTAHDICLLPDPPDADRLVGDLLVRGQRTMIAGGTGEGKSTLALQLVGAVTDALDTDDCLGQPVNPVGRVLIIDAEQGVRTIKRRLRERRLSKRTNIDYVRVPDGLRLDSDRGDVEAVQQLLEANAYDVVVFDPFYKLHGGDSNSERQIVDLMRQLDAWREQYNFALILPTHTRKLAPDATAPTIADVFGSSAVTWGAEVVLMIQRRKPGAARLHIVKDRDGDMAGQRLGLLFSTDGGFVIDPDAEDDDDSLQQRVLEYVRANPGCSQNAVKWNVKGSERRIIAALNQLYDDNVLARGSQRRGGFAYSVATEADQ